MPSRNVNTGVGCVSILPATLIGFAGLTDGIGPKGWRGISELSGWMIVSLTTAALLSLVLTRSNREGAVAYTLTLAIIAAIAAAAYELLNWLGLDAPMSAKMIFTSTMQLIGTVGLIACMALFVKAVWMHIRRAS